MATAKKAKITNCPPHGPRAQFCGNTHLNFWTGQLSAIPVWRGVALIKIVCFEVTLCSGIVHVPIWRIFVCKKCLLSTFCKFCVFIFWNACFCSLKAFGGCARFSARFLSPEQFGGNLVHFLFFSGSRFCLAQLFVCFLFLWSLLVLFCLCGCCFLCVAARVVVVVFLAVVVVVVYCCCCFCCCCRCYCSYMPQSTPPQKTNNIQKPSFSIVFFPFPFLPLSLFFLFLYFSSFFGFQVKEPEEERDNRKEGNEERN